MRPVVRQFVLRPNSRELRPLCRIVFGIAQTLIHEFFFFQAEDGIRDIGVTGVQTCALPISTALDDLTAGDVGYIAASIKDIRSCRVGDTITDADNRTDEPLPGYKKATPIDRKSVV